MDRGGAETLVMNYYRHIDRSKVQFDFLVHRPQRGAYDDEIEALGGRIFRMPPLKISNLSQYRKELRAFFEEHPEYRIIHAHMSELGFFAFGEAKRSGVPVRICHAHNAPKGFDLKLPFRLLLKHLIRPYITDMFMCGQASGEWLFGKKNANRFIQMNNAIDSTQFSFSEEKRNEIRESLHVGEKMIVGHVGRFHPQKNHFFILDVFAKLLQKEPEAELWLIGTGENKEEVEKRAEQLELSNKVRFWGTRSDVSDLMQAMDVFLFPSLYEGLSVSLVEAQAAGLPCLISDCIPCECRLTDLAIPFSLDSGAEDWADKLCDLRNHERISVKKDIIAAGFDIEKNAMWLQNYYLKRWKESIICQR